MKRLLLAATIAAGLSGCATQANFSAKMNGFVGQSEMVVVAAYGPPQGSYVGADGSRVIQYTKGNTLVLPGATTYQPVTTNTTGNAIVNQGLRQVTGSYNQQSTTYIPQQAPATQVNLSCTVTFTVDKEGIVRGWNANGNYCVAR
jgi:hypothetical protein